MQIVSLCSSGVALIVPVCSAGLSKKLKTRMQLVQNNVISYAEGTQSNRLLWSAAILQHKNNT